MVQAILTVSRKNMFICTEMKELLSDFRNTTEKFSAVFVNSAIVSDQISVALMKDLVRVIPWNHCKKKAFSWLNLRYPYWMRLWSGIHWRQWLKIPFLSLLRLEVE